MFGNQHSSIRTKKSIFLHYFDIHFIEEHIGNNSLSSAIIKEMEIATKIAFLTADSLLVPASSYVESEICRNILNRYNSLFGFYFSFIGKAANLEEFVCSKMEQYEEDSHQWTNYRELAQTKLMLPFQERQNSSTIDISNSWKKTKQINEVAVILDKYYNMPHVADKWYDIPEELGKKAFVVNNVLPLLVPNVKSTELTLRNKMHDIINKAYFESYLQEYNAGFIDDLVYLNSNSFDRSKYWSISYSNITHYLLENDLNKKYLQTPIPELPYLKSEWQKELKASKEYAIDKEKIIEDFIRSSSKTKVPIIINFGGDIIMGNKIEQTAVKGAFNKVIGNITQNIDSHQNSNNIDEEELSEIIRQLSNLIKNLSSIPTVIKNKDIGRLSNAEENFKKGDIHAGNNFLKKITKKTIDMAKTIGLGVLANYISSL